MKIVQYVCDKKYTREDGLSEKIQKQAREKIKVTESHNHQ